VDTSVDANNCGDCNNVCATGYACSSGICVGSGNLSFTATWDRVGEGDIWVKTPNDKLIYWGALGPTVDTDLGQQDADSYQTGPENVFWSSGNTPPSGTYLVCFEAYGDASYPRKFIPTPSLANPVNFTITIRTPGNPDQIIQGSRTVQSKSSDCTQASPIFVASITYP
jgi:hypothetical protein